MKLNVKDFKLLESLFENSKKSNRELSKEIGYSKETIATKVNSYVEEGIIKGFSLKANYDLLGFKEYNLFIRLKNTSEKSFDDIIIYLENHNNTTWIGKCFGKYDLKVSIILKDITKISLIINEIHHKFGKNILLIDSLLVIDKYKVTNLFFFNHLFGTSNLNKIKINKIIKPIENSNLDQIDKYLIYEFGKNPKQNYSKIALSLDLTAEAIKYRIKNLEKKQFILGNSVVFNGNKFNKIWCVVLINLNPDKLLDFKFYLKKKIFLSSYVETIGMKNMAVTFFANNVEDLNQDLNCIRDEFSENIRDFDFLIFFEIYKYPKIPKCILEASSE